MKLKAVELQGFKSFPDRTRLTFDDGVTVIVGPNGSGKSNISDAIKWVFGEQSVKSLRGAKMEDVIFSGSASRKPTGFAWVSLYIDNTDRTIDVDTDEVVITRRLYRSGESEYRINNNPVRLKDLNETFMDTGLGRDGYSIIEQGKIADIVSAKSSQRREIFEEAAGISKFRYRKTEAERKLEQAETNLVRLRDIMGELESRVGPLKTQSEKAKQYLVLAGEKKALEISLWLQTLDKLRRQRKEQEDKLLIAVSDRNNSRKKLDEISETLEALQHKTQDANIDIEQKREAIKALDEQNSLAKTDIAVKNNDLSHNEKALEDLERRRSAGALSADELTAKYNDLEEKIAAQDRLLQMKQSEIAEKQAEQSEKRREEMRLATEQQALLLQRDELQAQIHQAELSTEKADTLAEETVERLNLLREQAKDKDENLTRQRDELEGHSQFAEELREQLKGLQNSKNGYLYKLKGRSEKLTALEEEQRRCEKLAGERLQRAQVLSDLEKNYESFNNSVKLVMKQAGAGALRGIIGPVSSLIKTEDRFSTAVEIALGSAIQNIVTQDEGAAKRAIGLLREQHAGRATFLPLTSIKSNPIHEPELAGKGGYIGLASELVSCDDRYRTVIDYLLARTIVAEDLDAATAIAKSYTYRYRVVTLDGQLVNAGGSMTGGSVNKNASILSRRGEIDALREEAKKYAEKSDAAEAGLRELRSEIASLQAEVDGIEAEEKTAGEDLFKTETLIRQLQIALEEAERLNEQALQEYDRLTERVESLKKQKISSAELIAKLTEEISGLDDTAKQQEKRAAELTEELGALSDAITAEQIALTGLQKDCDSLTEERSRLEEQRSGNADALEQLERDCEALKESSRLISEEIDALKKSNEDGTAEIERIQQAIRGVQDELNAAEQEKNRLRSVEREAIANHSNAVNEVERLQEKDAEIQEKENSITAKMWEEYEVTRSDAAALTIPLEDTGAAQKRLGELKARIRTLGSVNLSAIEEYEEVSGRYEFMKGQIDDAENAKKELTHLITDLAARMSAIFLDRFASINHHFGEIFRELFGGGHAELSLTDPTDPLETGIDITVQPPGKIIKNLSALSGGEQAFVAICIYFSILRVNPAPFVLIDEIEAALDDVNVGKFAAYLHKMTDRTQFISITHRRGTMEEGDVLYGVTMEEEGISKLLRLNVAEMEQKFGKSLS